MKSVNINYNFLVQKGRQKIFKKIIPIPLAMGVITASVTYAKLETGQPFLENWLGFYLIALVIIAPLGFGILKVINLLVSRYLSKWLPFFKNLVFGLLMSFCMGSLMNGASLFAMQDFESINSFFSAWWMGIQTALPTILIIALLVGVIIKPLVDSKRKNSVKLNKTKE